jgi:hypothetical protein
VRAHGNDCGWFWTWAAVGAGLVLSFVGIFSVGPFLIPFVTLLLGVAATRRPRPLTIVAGVLVAVAGITAAVIAQWAFLATPLLTLAIGLAPAVPRSAQGVLRTLVIAAIVAACAVAAISVSPAAETVLAVVPLGLAAFALAVAGRLDAEVAGAVTGAGLAAVLLGGPPACLLLVAAGLAAFPLMRASAGPQPLSR